jgi:hypothetical protein
VIDPIERETSVRRIVDDVQSLVSWGFWAFWGGWVYG